MNTYSMSVQMGPDRAELALTKSSCSNLLAQMYLDPLLTQGAAQVLKLLGEQYELHVKYIC